MIDIYTFSPTQEIGAKQKNPRRVTRWLGFMAAAAIAALAAAGGASPALAVSGETTATLYSADAPSGFQITLPCDMGFETATENGVEVAKTSCHLWDEAAPDSETVAERDLGLAANVQIENPGLILPGQVDESNVTISSTTFAQVTCGLESDETEFCVMAASTAGTYKKKGKKFSVTPGALGQLLIRNDDCTTDCTGSGGPFDVTTDAPAIADENAALRLVYPEAAWVEWMFSMNNTDIGDTGAYNVTLDAGVSASPVSNGSLALASNVTVAPAEHFAAINTPGVYCSINGVCIFY